MNLLEMRRADVKEPSTAAARARWRQAREFEARARLVLALQKMEFIEWLLLQTLSELEQQDWEGVKQNEIARRTGVSRQLVSYWMIALDERGLVDRGPGEDPRSWGVLISERGEELLQACNERLAAAGLTE